MNSKNIILAGAAGNLGKTVLRKLLNEDKRVVALCELAHEKELQKEFADFHHSQKILILSCDLSVGSQVTQVLAKAQSFLGTIDALISVAGAFRYASIEESTEEQYSVLMNANFKSCWHLAQGVIPYMKKNKSGRILFTSAKATQGIGAEGMGLYMASKAALNALVLCLARELRDFNISVNAIMPTTIDTPANRKDMPDADFSKWVSMQDLATVFASLLEQDLSFINGSFISVPGKV